MAQNAQKKIANAPSALPPWGDFRTQKDGADLGAHCYLCPSCRGQPQTASRLPYSTRSSKKLDLVSKSRKHQSAFFAVLVAPCVARRPSLPHNSQLTAQE